MALDYVKRVNPASFADICQGRPSLLVPWLVCAGMVLLFSAAQGALRVKVSFLRAPLLRSGGLLYIAVGDVCSYFSQVNAHF